MEVQVGDTIVTFDDKQYKVDEIFYLKTLKDGKVVDSKKVLYYGCNKICTEVENENCAFLIVKQKEIKKII